MFRLPQIRWMFFCFIIPVLFIACQRDQSSEYLTLIEAGEFTKATEKINRLLETDPDLTDQQKFELSFEIERMRRIQKDFTKTEEEVIEYIKEYIPEVTREDLARWEKNRSLEYKMIDGKKIYFNRAARNLFRVDAECNKIWKEYYNKKDMADTTEEFNFLTYNQQIIDEVLKTGKNFVKPVKMRIRYSISLKPDRVPEGEIIRCWIPFPREIPGRQEDIHLINSNPVEHRVAAGDQLQRTVYMEQPSKGSAPTLFSIEYAYTNHGVYYDIDPDKVLPVDPEGELKMYLREEPPHIVFTDEMKTLSQKIIGDETNIYRKAQILFAWVYDHTPWASAREYSTISSLSRYGFENSHGDCGIQSMLFTTLCRLDGIPARWQSGWAFMPPDDTMHDWGMIYFAPYGWIPMDPYCGPQKTDDQKLKYFYLNGMDGYRLVFNDYYSQPFSPPKKHHRSETIDSQRGELEWAGGNLYFDQWEWNMEWEVIEN